MKVDVRFGSKRSRFGFATIATALAIALVAVGCGGSSTSDSSQPSGTAGGTGSSDTSPNVVKPAETPKDGGKLVMGLEAETDGWDPTVNRWANSGTEVALAVFDPLVSLDKDLKTAPYLAQSITPNTDFKVWTIKLRSGISFHDGEPLNSAAVKKFFDKYRASTLTGAAARPITKVETPDDLTVVVTMDQSWATYPFFLTAQGGVIPAPKMLDDPDGSRKPIGTGPFVFSEWKTDQSFTASKNPNYWRKGLPHVSSVEFKPIPDTRTRYTALQSSDIDVMITSQEATISQILSDAKQGNVQLTRSQGDNDVNMLLMNVTSPPFDDIRVRQAVAYGIDRESLGQVTETDPLLTAYDLYTADSQWHTDSGFPRFDPVKAKAFVDDYVKDKGPLSFSLGTTNDPDVIKAVQAIAAQLQNIGAKVDVQTLEQSTYILNAVTGKYQIYIWRQFGASDPDINYIWWVSANATTPSFTLNMARNQDPQIDAAMQEGRRTLDVAARKAAYDKVQKRQAEDLPYVWLSHLRWTLAARNNVHGIETLALPDGGTSAGLVGGVMPVTGMWVDS